MKKFLAMLAIAGIMVSCGGKKKDEKPADKPAAETPATNSGDNNAASNSSTPATSDKPAFADAEVQKYVDDYTAFVNSYIDAIKSKDMTKASGLAMKAADWATRSADVAKKLATSPEEAKKFGDYMTKLGTDWANAAKELVPAMK